MSMDYQTQPRHQTSKKPILSKRRHSNQTAQANVTSVDKNPPYTSNTARKIISARRRVSKTSQQPHKNNPNKNIIVQWNIYGLMGKVPELQLLTNELKPKVVALQETMFDDMKYVDRLDNQKYKWYIQLGHNATKTEWHLP